MNKYSLRIFYVFTIHACVVEDGSRGLRHGYYLIWKMRLTYKKKQKTIRKICDKYATNGRNYNYFKSQKCKRSYRVSIQEKLHGRGEVWTKYIFSGHREGKTGFLAEEIVSQWRTLWNLFRRYWVNGFTWIRGS